MATLTVEETDIDCLVDTGATQSTLNCPVSSSLLSTENIHLTGFSGVTQKLPLTVPLETSIAGQTVMHRYVHSQDSPISLLGRDLLMKLGAEILCSPEGITLTFPNGTSFNCSVSTPLLGPQMLLSPTAGTDGPTPPHANIYWGILAPETPDHGGLLSAFLLWKPWISLLAPYSSPSDPYHVTLFYDRDLGEVYHEQFLHQLQDTTHTITTSYIWVGPEGVSASVSLPPELLPWYEMAPDSVPHCSLLISSGHQAKQLGPMSKRCTYQTDWIVTDIPNVEFSPALQTYRISVSTTDRVTMEFSQVQRNQGYDQSDHEDSAEMLESLPHSLWSTGPTDVGCCTGLPPVTFSIASDSPIWLPQYRLKPQAESGISDTIEGLLSSGVL